MLFVGCAPPTYSLRSTSLGATHGPGHRALVIVRVPSPWYAPRFAVRGKFRDLLHEYEPLAALEAKYFTITDEGEFGGIYLWKSRDDAEKHFDAAWRADLRKRRGVDPEAAVLILDAPYLIEGQAEPVGKAIGARSVEYPAWASFVRWELPSAVDPLVSAKTLAVSPGASDGLIRGLVVIGPSTVGIVKLWASRAAAEKAVTLETRDALGKAVLAGSSSFTLFEAPLLVDETIRNALAADQGRL